MYQNMRVFWGHHQKTSSIISVYQFAATLWPSDCWSDDKLMHLGIVLLRVRKQCLRQLTMIVFQK